MIRANVQSDGLVFINNSLDRVNKTLAPTANNRGSCTIICWGIYSIMGILPVFGWIPASPTSGLRTRVSIQNISPSLVT